jgi:hypothetical protein
LKCLLLHFTTLFQNDGFRLPRIDRTNRSLGRVPGTGSDLLPYQHCRHCLAAGVALHDVDYVSLMSFHTKNEFFLTENFRIPVYPINASRYLKLSQLWHLWAQQYAGYMGPLTLYLYFKYGRAKKLEKHAKDIGEALKHADHLNGHSHDIEKLDANERTGHHDGHDATSHEEHHDHMHAHHDAQLSGHDMHNMGGHETHNMTGHDMHNMTGHNTHMHDMGGDRPMWATVFIGVSHCGAGCVLGDLVGEWLIYGTGAMIRGHDIWPCLLVDYAFALLFGIVFQYFSIAPMSGEYGPKTIIRAAKADILSLTAFEIGLFGWMIIYQVGIWDYKLEMNTWTVSRV